MAEDDNISSTFQECPSETVCIVHLYWFIMCNFRYFKYNFDFRCQVQFTVRLYFDDGRDVVK